MSKVLVLGSTPNPSRYAYKAIDSLLSHGYTVIPFGVKKGDVLGLSILNDWKHWENVDTVTLYVNESNQKEYEDKLIELTPRRIIFNPGTENPAFYRDTLIFMWSY